MRRLLLRRREVAELLGVSPKTIDRLIREGALEVVRVRRSARVALAALERFIEERRSQGPGGKAA